MNGSDPFRGLVATRPRLMADAAAIARAKAAIAASPAGQKILTEVVQQADKIAGKPPVKGDFKPRIRLPLDHLSDARQALSTLQTLGMAWFMTGNQKYVTRAKAELTAICRFPAWQDPDHFLDTAEMTHAAAIGYDWFYGQLDDDQRTTIATAIIKKGLSPGLQQLTGTPNPAWPTRVTNWNLVCNGGLIIGALGIAGFVGADEIDAALIRKVFELGRRSVLTGLRGYAPDGAWNEGPGYWTYATEYLAYMLSAMRTALGTEFGLGDAPGLADTGLFRLHAEGPPASTSSLAGLLFNFSDSPETHSGSWCMRWLAQRYNRPVFSWVANHRRKPEAMDLLWFSPDGPPPDGIPPNAHFRGTELVFMRGDWDATDEKWLPWAAPQTPRDLGITYVGIKAGRNTVVNHHGHLDLGGFVLDSDGVRWAVDIPPVADVKWPCLKADYDLDGYFDPRTDQRYSYYRTSTTGHNTLVVNRTNQALEVEAKITAFQSTYNLTRASIDLTPAYPDCLSAKRGFALIERQHVLIVDEITTSTAVPVTWQMHTRADVSLDGRIARLSCQPDGAPAVKELFLHLLEPAGAVFELQSTDFAPPQAPNTGIRKLAICVADATKPTRIAVYVSAKRVPPEQMAELSGPLASWGALQTTV